MWPQTIKYLKQPVFENEKIKQAVLKQNQKMKKKHFFSEEKLFLGQYFCREIEKGLSRKLALKPVSSVIGLGVFALEKIAHNSFVTEFTGIIRKRRWRLVRHNMYLMRYPNAEPGEESYTIDAEKDGNFSRFINHSFDPNLDIVSVYYQEQVRVLLLALKDIEIGEQLTCNYGDDYWHGLAKKVRPL